MFLYMSIFSMFLGTIFTSLQFSNISNSFSLPFIPRYNVLRRLLPLANLMMAHFVLKKTPSFKICFAILFIVTGCLLTGMLAPTFFSIHITLKGFDFSFSTYSIYLLILSTFRCTFINALWKFHGKYCCLIICSYL